MAQAEGRELRGGNGGAPDERVVRLERAVAELSVLNDLAGRIGASTDPEEIIAEITRRSVRALGGAQAVVSLVDPADDGAANTVFRHRTGAIEQDRFHFGGLLLGWMAAHRRPLLSNAPLSDARLQGLKLDPGVGCLLCVPLLAESRLIGVLTVLGGADHGGFQPEDQRLLAIIASQSAQVLENARLAERDRSLIRLEEQLTVARRIQGALLPAAPAAGDGFDIAGCSVPASDVGGDSYDYGYGARGRLVVNVADVAGKGVAAALLMANVQATLRALETSVDDLGERLVLANRLLCAATDAERFVTLFLAELDPRDGGLRYCGAGHAPPLVLRRDGRRERLQVGGPPLGILSHFVYEASSVMLQPGDVLLFWSDGVTDAADAGGETFGQGRLEQAAAAAVSATSAVAIRDRVLNAVRDFVGPQPPWDDLTLVVLRRGTSP